MKIAVNHLTRIEGHANLVINAGDGTLEECRLEVVETPRFFEAILLGRHYSEVAHMVARICGVCSHSHTLASLTATERALNLTVSDQTLNLRKLLAFGEILQSHVLHLYFMALPDYLGVPSLFPLVQTHRDVVGRALRLKKLGNDLCNVVGGRPVHPVTPCVGGFAALPGRAELQDLRQRLGEALPDLEETIDLFASLDLPDFLRETVYLSLIPESEYPLLGDTVTFSSGFSLPVAEFESTVSEYLPERSTAKYALVNRQSYQVGPLARTRNAFHRLSPMARKVADALGLTAASANPFQNLTARLVEVVQIVDQSLHLIDNLLLDGLRQETLPVPAGGGCGAGAVEAPRGLLYHRYSYDEDGLLTGANCIIPTAQNLANIEGDLQVLIPRLFPGPREELTRQAEMLIRAYDPCISCSTHLVKIDFV